MEKIDLLFVLTFVFGTLRLITLSKLFKSEIHPPLMAFIHTHVWDKTAFRGLLFLLDSWTFYLSILYQTWFWMWYLQ